ncbi:GCN5-related N-acetyltransferase [Citrobacter freundii]|uniref:GCN5-related N-acetyltransferase n=1 Tax=Citrobacter freundii TaxID=546 RepID=A0A7G2IZF5_CITFR|nr:GCN5-related N-acetyltransferase [Citrobacter freundii]
MASGKQCFVLSAAQILSRIDELSDVLERCVNDGASISFMLPFNREKSEPFWMTSRKVFLAENGSFLVRRTRRGRLSVPSNSLSINLKINPIVLMLPNCWFTPQRDAVAWLVN